jgi:hypothetical protein
MPDKKWTMCECECPKCKGMNSMICCNHPYTDWDYEHRCLLCGSHWVSFSGQDTKEEGIDYMFVEHIV